MSTFAERLKHALDAKGLSGYALARSSSLTPSYISRLLREERPPNLSYATASAVARALGVSTDWLMSGEGVGPLEATAPASAPRTAAITIARQGGVDGETLEEVAASHPAGSEDWQIYAWIGFIQYLATVRASAVREKPASSKVRPRADIRDITTAASRKKD